MDENINFEDGAKEIANQAAKNSLGKANSFVEDSRPIMADIGWLNINIENLPSKGSYYPTGTQIAIRAASVSEIRHWSTIDQNDILGMDDMLNYVIEKCCTVKVPGQISSWKDIKEIDRFYIIFAIREFTFKDGENKIYLPNTGGEKVEIKKEMIQYFSLEEKLKKFYSQETKDFVMNLRNGETIRASMPNIGVSVFIKNYVRSKIQNKQSYDEAFIKFAPFIFDDYRNLSTMTYEKAVQDSVMWSIEKISILSTVSDLLGDSVNPTVVYNGSEGEVTAQLDFQGGIKSLFIISDIFDQLV